MHKRSLAIRENDSDVGTAVVSVQPRTRRCALQSTISSISAPGLGRALCSAATYSKPRAWQSAALSLSMRHLNDVRHHPIARMLMFRPISS